MPTSTKTLAAMLSATALFGLGALGAPGAQAQTVTGVQECWTGNTSAGDAGGWQRVSQLADPATQCHSAVVTVFRNDPGLVGLSNAQKVIAAQTRCQGPNGPYRRAGDEIRFDYVLINANKNAGTFSANAGAQINGSAAAGTFAPESGTLAVTTTVNNQAGSWTINDTSAINSGADTDQIVDIPGFEWVLFSKSSGTQNNQATLVCEINAWYDPTMNLEYSDAVFGLRTFVPTHAVQDIDIAYAMGPSGFGSQANVNAACADQNPVLSVENANRFPAPGDKSTAQEQFAVKLLGAYKTLPGDPPPPINATSCAVPDDGVNLENYCDGGEFIGRPNACNTGGDASGVAGYVQQQSGTGTTCQGFYFGGFSGSPTLGTTSLCGK